MDNSTELQQPDWNEAPATMMSPPDDDYPEVDESLIKVRADDVDEDPRQTDRGNAKRLKEDFGGDVRYCPELKAWFVWAEEAGVWKRDPDALQIKYRAKMTFQRLRQTQAQRSERLEPGLEPFRDKLTKKLEVRADKALDMNEKQILAEYTDARTMESWFTRSENETLLNSAIASLASEPGMSVRPAQFDANPLLLNCLNGTLDLKRCTFRAHRREDYCAMQAPVEFRPDLTGLDRTLFDGLVHRILPEDDKRNFMHRAMGLALSGLADERALMLMLGGGANGKGTLIRIMVGVLGDDTGYAAMASMSSFIVPKFVDNDERRNDLVALIGKRFVAVSESNEKAPPMNTALLKCFAGGDGKLKIRGNHETTRNFQPEAKLFIASNAEPKFHDDSDGFWSRLKKVWFDVQIPADEQDVDLVGKILETERAAVLQWLLEGWKAYWSDRQAGRQGLPTPKCIAAETAEYRDEQTQVAVFLTDCYRFGTGSRNPVAHAVLYATYKKWSEANGERRPLTSRVLSSQIRGWAARHKVFERKPENVLTWYGLEPVDSPASDQGDLL